ncbi:uncharacterized protein [Narcine bancroftii]|uniref:uncharacterized protein n=1 Tax=Narcine bancroftii TaxID=1343680 RepID=UPI0038311F61
MPIGHVKFWSYSFGSHQFSPNSYVDNHTAMHAATPNVALGGTATQSTTELSAVADRAIDGNNNWNANLGSCTQTKRSKDPWWRVDLKSTYVFFKIRITNRGDCCSDAIGGAEVRIGNSLENDGNRNKLCGTIRSVAGSYTLDCSGLAGRYMNIRVPGHNKVLALCEVEIFGRKVLSQSDKAVNVAWRGKATQSSTSYGGSASRAIDGNAKNMWQKGSCTHTKRSTNPWWQVDLKGIHAVSIVKLSNRGDCCSERLIGAEIRIGNSLKNYGNNNRLCGTVRSVTTPTNNFTCHGLAGRYVNIIIPGQLKILSLCEFEVYGWKVQQGY